MQQRALTICLIQVAMAGSILIPCLIFGYTSWVSYRNEQALAEERVIRSLDVQQEQLLKVFQLVDLTLNNAGELVAGMSDAGIRDNEERLHLEFKKLVGAVPLVQSIWIYDR